MTSENKTGYRTFQATAAALALGVRVKVDSNGLISAADAGANWIGVTQEAVAASGYGTVKLRNADGTFLVTASAAVTRGAALFTTDAGKVDDAAGGQLAGLVALEAATADGDIIEAAPADGIAFTAGAAQADLAAYVDGTNGLDSAANMQALYDQVVAIKTALKNAGIIKGGA